MPLTVSAIAAFLEQFAPPRLAAEWDNVGLLVGDGRREVRRAMTCLTVTPASVAEAVREQVDLVVAHHPVLFRPLRRLTTESTEGEMLLALVAANVAVYSPHTAFDSARSGINQRLSEGFGLSDIGPLVPDVAEPALGTGRFGFPGEGATLGSIAARVKDFLNVPQVQIVGNLAAPVRAVAVACGSAGDMLADARRAGCDLFVTGEARFHTCLEAEATGIGLILAGHYATERFAVEQLAEVLAAKFPGLHAWPSREERDPLRFI